MDAKTIAIIEYFNGQRQCVMPPFQRSYVWDTDKWGQLWDDIVAFYGSEIDMDARHFLGAVVTLPLKTHPVGVNKHMIIDGQQRLTTLSILLCAVREKLTESSKKGLVDDYLVNRHYEDADRFKVVPTITNGDRDVFCRLITGEQTPLDASHQIVRAFRHYMQLLGGSDEEGNPIDPTKILQIIQYSLQVVMVNLDDDHDDPYVIFESLNAKSEKLEESDLVRNFVLMKFRHSKSGTEQERVYSQYWQPLQNTLGARLTEFLRHYSVFCRQGEQIRKRGIYNTIKRLWKDSSELVEGQLKETLTLSEYYKCFINPSLEKESALRSSFDTIQALRVNTCFPLLLRLHRERDLGRLTPDELVAAVRLLESFLVRRAVCDLPTNSYNRLFAQLCRDFPSSGELEWLEAQLLEGSGNRRWPSDAEVRASISTIPVYQTQPVVLVVLRNIEARVCAHKEAGSLSSSLQIEHIMPQTLTELWKAALGDAWKDIHQRLKDTFGNLTLTGYNAEMSNEPFEKKKQFYTDSHLEITKQVAKYAFWGENEIASRAEWIAAACIQLWPRKI